MIDVIVVSHTPYMQLIHHEIYQIEAMQVTTFQELSMDFVTNIHADIVMFDIDAMALEETKPIVQLLKEKQIKLIGVTEGKEACALFPWIEVGLDTVLHKENDTLERIAFILQTVNEGYYYIPQHTMPIFIKEVDKLQTIQRGKFYAKLQNYNYDLSPKESQIAYLMRRGLKNSEIARIIGVTEGTVKVHISHIYKKLGMKRRKAVVELFNAM
ncbi:helix-turn-helix transcriptional regulator [Ornithinibacillus salinisoli]|uniref:Helix-turn-helix transcriptional regulator n=1 Tax=Ornithinibacillus salinisoli TaxID=1848459 RepID=A0ABW4VZ58_9BACI